ncbi:MAG: hypothetical protein WCQ90_03000 [Deltaproteobacteria bacterium]
MAIMIPADIDEFHTEGEERFYHFLNAVAKPDEQYIVWYTLTLTEKNLTSSPSPRAIRGALWIG